MSTLVIGFSFVLAFYLALLASLTLTPYVRSQAIRWGFVDRPDGGRKAHKQAVALGGGVAVLIAAVVAAANAFGAASAGGQQFLDGKQDAFFGLLAAAILIALVGIVDDFVGLRGRYKVIGQIVASALLIGSGVWIQNISLFGAQLDLGVLAVPFTLFWLLGAINAINLLDGIDGLASTVGIVLCLTLAVLAAATGSYPEAVIVLSVAGALLGFLRYNFAPASIYLGDTGSMLVGLVIGTVAITSSLKGSTTMALVVPFAVCAIPILDSAAAILRRKLTGRSLFATDRGHFHHSLLVRGWSVRKTVLFIGSICAVTCGGALLAFFYENELIAVGGVVAVIILLIVSKTFGHIEFALVRDRVRSSTGILGRLGRQKKNHVHESRIRLQGSQEWDHLWTALIESAERYDLLRIELTLHLPALHEAFYANWNCSSTKVDYEDAWRMDCPLTAGDITIGKIAVMGTKSDGSSFSHIGQVVDFLDPVAEDIRRVVEELSKSQSASRKMAQQDAPPVGEPEGLEGAVDSTEPVANR